MMNLVGTEGYVMKSRSCEVIEDDGCAHFGMGNDPLTCKTLVTSSLVNNVTLQISIEHLKIII